VPLGESPEIFDLSPDGKTAYVSIEDENVMAAYDLATKKPLFQVKTGGEPEGVMLSKDGKMAYVTSEVANLVHLIDLASRKVVKDIKVGKRPRRFAATPDGKRNVGHQRTQTPTVSVLDATTHRQGNGGVQDQGHARSRHHPRGRG
jgi:YVTN family beta-propeller protein